MTFDFDQIIERQNTNALAVEGVEGGEMFIADGGRNVRLNVACPRKMLDTALDQIIEAIHSAKGSSKAQ